MTRIASPKAGAVPTDGIGRSGFSPFLRQRDTLPHTRSQAATSSRGQAQLQALQPLEPTGRTVTAGEAGAATAMAHGAAGRRHTQAPRFGATPAVSIPCAAGCNSAVDLVLALARASKPGRHLAGASEPEPALPTTAPSVAPSRRWWRRRTHEASTRTRLCNLGGAFAGSAMLDEPRWADAVHTSSAATGIAPRAMKTCGTPPPIVDLMVPSVLMAVGAGKAGPIPMLVMTTGRKAGRKRPLHCRLADTRRSFVRRDRRRRRAVGSAS